MTRAALEKERVQMLQSKTLVEGCVMTGFHVFLRNMAYSTCAAAAGDRRPLLDLQKSPRKLKGEEGRKDADKISKKKTVIRLPQSPPRHKFKKSIDSIPGIPRAKARSRKGISDSARRTGVLPWFGAPRRERFQRRKGLETTGE